MALTILAGTPNEPLAHGICRALGVTPCARTIERFPDSELHVEIDQGVRGRDVYLVEPMSAPVDEHVMELVFLTDACRRAGAARVTAVMPYFGYARQDRRASGREAIGARSTANLLEAAGVERVVTLDLHAAAIEGFFQIPVEHLTAARLLAEAVSVTADSVLVAPDLGALKLAERYQAHLRVPVAVIHKSRITGSDVLLRALIGNVKDRAPIIVDDMIATGGTIEAAVKGVLDAGCKRDVTVVATHLVLAGAALARLQALHLRQVVGANTVAPAHALPDRFRIVDVAPLIASAIERLHSGQTLERLLAHV